MTIRLLHLVLLFAIAVAMEVRLDAQVLQRAEDDFGTCSGTRDNSNGTVTLTTERVRTGTTAFKHNVVPPTSGNTKRAELDCGGFAKFDPEKTFWYGFSVYLPAADFPATLGEQFVNQLRFSNIPFGGFSVPNCKMNKVCGAPDIYGGSGHELLFQSGQLNFYLRHQEPGCADCEALDQVVFNLGTAPLDQWVDFVYEGQWTGERDGAFRIWMQTGGGGYQLLVDYRGRSWVENHTAGSQLAQVGGANPYAPRVAGPNYTVGLYYNDDNANRTMYSDHVTIYQQEPGVDGFEQVSVAGVGPVVECATLDQPCDDGNARTVDDRFNASCNCVGVPIGPEASPASMSFGVAAATQTLSVISNTTYTISDDAAWLSIDLTSGTGDVTAAVTVTENTTGADRTATITVDDGFNPVTVAVTQSGAACGPTPWTSAASFTPQSGQFNLAFDLRTLGSTIRNGVVGVTQSTMPGGFDDNAVLLRLSDNGVFDVRDGGAYRSDAVLATAPNTTYAVLFEVNGNTGTYDVTVTPSGGTAVKIADNYKFRSSWAGQLPLRNVSTVVLGSGCTEVQSLVMTPISGCTAAGTACDDGNACTTGDVRDANCNCVGTFADADGDGICDASDPCDDRTIGQACDDGDPNTTNDVVGANCVCAGTFVCPAGATQLELTPSSDAELRQDAPDANFDNGDGSRIKVQKRTAGQRDRHGLFKWDLSALPPNTTVTDARLVFEYFNFNGDVPVDVALFDNPVNWDRDHRDVGQCPGRWRAAPDPRRPRGGHALGGPRHERGPRRDQCRPGLRRPPDRDRA